MRSVQPLYQQSMSPRLSFITALRYICFQLFGCGGTKCSQRWCDYCLNLPKGDDFRLALRRKDKIRTVDNIDLVVQDRKSVDWKFVVLGA